MKTWKSIFKSKQVRKECLYSFMILMGIRLLATIPTPGTNPDYFKTLIHNNSALTFIDAMTGNGLSGMSIMALSITPYITASIMVQLAGVIYPRIHEMEKGMEDERKRIHIITLVLGGFVALMESSMIAFSFGKKGLLVSAKWYWILLVMLIWTAGSVVASLAGELIRKKYDFNGSSLILLFNILASYPSDALSVYQTMISGKQMVHKVISSILIVLFVIALFAYTVCLQAAERRIPITHSQKIKGTSMKSTLPLKACPGTVVPSVRNWTNQVITAPINPILGAGKEGKMTDYTCPICGKKMEEYLNMYGCSGHKEKTCDFKVPKKVCGVTLKAADLDSLFKNGQTQTIKGFVSKEKKKFNARLIVDRESGKVKFYFPPAEETELTCPFCNKSLKKYDWGYACPDRSGCGFHLGTNVCKHELTEDEVRQILVDGRTANYISFVSKKGNKFRAAIVLDRDSKQTKFETEEW